jgi:hypothetical protein
VRWRVVEEMRELFRDTLARAHVGDIDLDAKADLWTTTAEHRESVRF